MTTPTWPIALLRPQKITPPFLVPRTLVGAAALSGRVQVSATDAGVWMCRFEEVPIHNRATVLAWRAYAALLEGRLNPVNVPLFLYEQTFAPYVDADTDAAAYAALLAAVPHSDDAYFSDDSGYAIEYVIDVVTSGVTALRATSMTVVVNYGGDIQAGHIFSIEHATKGHRWYHVLTFNEDTGAMTFRPPLREAVPSGTNLNFDRPTCRMKLATDTVMESQLYPPNWGMPSVSFVEDL